MAVTDGVENHGAGLAVIAGYTFLLQQGFPPDRLRVESYADTRPVAGNDTSSGRAKNRRVELHVELQPVEEAVGSAD